MTKEMFATGLKVAGWFGIASAVALVTTVVLVLAQGGEFDDREAMAKGAHMQQLTGGGK